MDDYDENERSEGMSESDVDFYSLLGPGQMAYLPRKTGRLLSSYEELPEAEIVIEATANRSLKPW